jgi:hypothetical protein
LTKARCAARFAGRAHEGIRGHVELDHLDVQQQGLRCVGAARRHDERLQHRIGVDLAIVPL